MANPLSLLIRENLKTLFSTKGFIFIVIAAFIPPLLTAAWVFTHQNDVEVRVDEIVIEPADPDYNSTINVTVTVRNSFRTAAEPFNVTIRIGYPSLDFQNRPTFTTVLNQTRRVDGLPPRGSTTLNVSWPPEDLDQRSGSYIVDVFADSANVLPEIEERNNNPFKQFKLRFPAQRPTVPPVNSTPDASLPNADLVVEGFTWSPTQLFAEDNATLNATVRNAGPGTVANATVQINIYRLSPQGFILDTVRTVEEKVTLAPGNRTPVRLDWQDVEFGLYGAEAVVRPEGAANDPNPGNNQLIEILTVDRKVEYQAPEPKATIKDFYRDVLQLLHFRLLIPLIALFYAAGVLHDEREKGNLLYLLSRPVPRWTIPIARFFVSFIVAGAALIVGIIATYILLLGTPNAEPGYFYWPVLFSLLTLFVYTAFFTLVGVLWDRPYLIGLLYTLAFEAFILLGRSILVNGRPLLQDWVQNLSLSYWVLEAFKGWDPKMALQFWPEGEKAVNALYIILAIGVGSVLAASFVMKRREFDV